MSWGMGNVGGGSGLGSAFAVIAVSYPVGSTCTCTKGTRTLRAKDTSGAYLFAIPEAGTWTVSCTDGTQTKSQSVVISSQYQAENVQLYYTLSLYNQGDENIPVTGGWIKTRGIITKGSNYIDVHGNGNECGIGQTASKIDFTQYTKMHFGAYTTGGNGFSFGLTSTTSHGVGNPSGIVASTAWDGAKSFQDFVLNISNISGSYYAYIYSHAYETSNKIVMSYMYLE